VVDLTGPNGSASTIEATSNPPSANAPISNGRLGESESPVLQMKRHPAHQAAYAETPGSNPRNVGVLGRESYAMLSSPAAQHMEMPLDEQGGQRWGGNVRPMIAAPSGPPGPGRADTTRVPMTHRNGIGVGDGLFGR
jgi:hypothetical protein